MPHDLPPRQGLYDPAHEHDACGVNFIVHMKGLRSHDIVQQGIGALRNLAAPRGLGQRGQHGRRGRHPVADPGPLPARGGRLRPAGRGLLRHRHRLPARRSGQGRRGGRRGGEDRGQRGPAGAGLARPALRRLHDRLHRGGGRALVPPGVPGRRRPGPREPGAAGLHRAQAHRARGGEPGRGGQRVLPEPVVSHPGLQGHAHHAAAGPVLPRPARRAVESALALVHSRFSTNTFPSLAPGPPVPLHRPQRRDQHRAGQPQLDAGPRGPAGQRPDPGDLDRIFPICTPGRQRLGHLRRGPRAAAPGRATSCPTPC